MAHQFSTLTFTPDVTDVQREMGSRPANEKLNQLAPANDTFGPDEQTFISRRDGFYIATVGETGWPYIQFRGGPSGFLHILDDRTLAYADITGNRQYITTGNLRSNPRAALFFMDYPNQTRLKILGHVEIHEHDDVAPMLIEQLRTTEPNAIVERAILIHVSGFSFNCPQHITPRYTLAELEPVLAPLHKRLAALEAENANLRERLKTSNDLVAAT
jgi:uncharacterized protein